MEACTRVATRKEIPGFVRPLVCILADRIFYRYDSPSGTVSDPEGRILTRRSGPYGDHHYVLPDQSILRVRSKDDSWLFDGARIEERWPTTTQRILVVGHRQFRVKPEDDTIWFEVADGIPQLDMAIVGFFLCLG